MLLLTVFNNESPVYLKEKGKEEELLKVLNKFYTEQEARRRYRELEKLIEKKEGF